jgi:L-threonylcarbamoyladenylate synthase
MTEIINIHDIDEKEILNSIRCGEIIIYPTDTIYGIGCNALNEEAVMKIREIKQRNDKPFSVIAPSKLWISNNFVIKKSYLDKLPGPFTYVINAKKKNVVSNAVVSGNKIGVRIPDYPFYEIIQKAKVPFVTTSVNVTGRKPYLAIRKIPRRIMNMVDIAIDAGTLDNSPSTVFDLTKELPIILR